MSKQNTTVTIAANLAETIAIQDLERILDSSNSHPQLISSNGEIIALPEPVYQALYKVIQAMAEGKVISLAPVDRELSTQETADILNVSRPYLIEKLLKTGKIPYIMVGNRHRIRYQDAMKYKQQRNRERHETLKEFTNFLQEEGFYDG